MEASGEGEREQGEAEGGGLGFYSSNKEVGAAVEVSIQKGIVTLRSTNHNQA